MSTEKRINQQIRTVERLLGEYQQVPGLPLARFLTGFYKRNRQMGSTDRKAVSRLAYNYFRLGRAASKDDLPTRLTYAEFLCNTESTLVQLHSPALYPYIGNQLSEKIARLEAQTTFAIADVFPFTHRLSAAIDQQAFLNSLFLQPRLFIRIRAPYRAEVLDTMTKHDIPFQLVDELCVALPNSTPLERLTGLAGKFEVQDWSSQQTGNYFQAAQGELWWDACAGSGGKSLLLTAIQPGAQVLVSDRRRSILKNLDERFDKAGIRSYRQKVIDLTNETDHLLHGEQFDGILLDVPCTGSGTWGRTPEMISVFDEGEIDRFSALQRQLAEHVIKHLKPGKPLVYMTCSAFAAENEEVISFLQTEHGLQLEQQAVLHGYLHRADTMFVARLSRA